MSAKTPRKLLQTGLLAGLILWLPAVAPGEEEAIAAGHEAFLDNRCNTCHAVASVEIAAKSEKLAGPDLGGYVVEDFAALAAYLRKEAERDGEEHSKTLKGTDEELGVILDWLATLEPAS